MQVVSDFPRRVRCVALGSTVFKIDPSSNRVARKSRTDGVLKDLPVGEGAVWVNTRSVPVARLNPTTGEFEPAVSDPLLASLDVDATVSSLSAADGFVWYANDLSKFARLDPVTEQVDLLELDLSARDIAVYQKALAALG